MIVVSNTSPLTNLAAIGQFHLLQALYEQIYIADGVWAELNAHGQPWPDSVEVAGTAWIEQHPVENQQLVTAFQRDLDRGEAESIALALEIGADLILLDEKDGRHAAKRLGLRVVGVLGILLEAKANGHIQLVRPHVDALRHTAGFFVSELVYQEVIKLAHEQP